MKQTKVCEKCEGQFKTGVNAANITLCRTCRRYQGLTPKNLVPTQGT